MHPLDDATTAIAILALLTTGTMMLLSDLRRLLKRMRGNGTRGE